MQCPRCGSAHTVKNGRIHNGKAKRLCKDCCRQFVPDATKEVVTPLRRGLHGFLGVIRGDLSS